jgi:hypothetical protein
LKALPLELSKFAYTYLKKSLALPPPADARGKPSVEELDAVLLHYLVADRGGQHIRTWGTLELESELCLGVQRVRCFPFKCDKALKSNPKNYVAVIPPSKFTDIRFAKFDLADASHRRKLWFGRVELFFQCSFRNAGGRDFKIDLALISCLYDQTVLQREGGARMFYVPDTQWLIVLPINHIVGRVPLMKAYLRGSSSPTIPHRVTNSLITSKHTSDTDTQIGTEERAAGAHCSCSTCICGNSGDHRLGQYLCSNVMQTRNGRKRLPIRNALNVCLTPGTKPSRVMRTAMRTEAR